MSQKKTFRALHSSLPTPLSLKNAPKIKPTKKNKKGGDKNTYGPRLRARAMAAAAFTGINVMMCTAMVDEILKLLSFLFSIKVN
jgi:hypothetical protein